MAIGQQTVPVQWLYNTTFLSVSATTIASSVGATTPPPTPTLLPHLLLRTLRVKHARTQTLTMGLANLGFRFRVRGI